jgi:hypothetical protein
MTGLPFTVTYSSTYLDQEQGATNTAQQVNPNVAITHTINTVAAGGGPWFDITAFAAPPCQSATATAGCSTGAPDQAPGAYQQTGNAGRNALIGPGFFNLNAALSKQTTLTERVKMQLRMETVNSTNTPQFGNPSGSCCTGNFGDVTSTIGSGSGTINSGTGNVRSVQIAVKFIF